MRHRAAHDRVHRAVHLRCARGCFPLYDTLQHPLVLSFWSLRACGLDIDRVQSLECEMMDMLGQEGAHPKKEAQEDNDWVRRVAAQQAAGIFGKDIQDVQPVANDLYNTEFPGHLLHARAGQHVTLPQRVHVSRYIS